MLTTLVLLNYTKAFDRINHKLIIEMLYHIGFSYNVMEFMTDNFGIIIRWLCSMG